MYKTCTLFKIKYLFIQKKKPGKKVLEILSSTTVFIIRNVSYTGNHYDFWKIMWHWRLE